ncbi:MAG: hypothetical protein KGO82_01930 [Bacteroidota bacterium]|nr:hypothetical protein [Bacteroidota bacterium]
MENTLQAQPAATPDLYHQAAQLLVNQKQTPSQAIHTMVNAGASERDATAAVEDLHGQIITARKKHAEKDMLYGALWCIGGTVLTLADIGFIFWGAIVFGGIQFFKGVMNYSSAS